MKLWLARQLRNAAYKLDPLVPEPTSGDVGSYFERDTSTATEDAVDQRAGDALSLADEDVRGYLILVVRGFNDTVIEPRIALTEKMWPAVIVTMARLVAEGKGVLSGRR